MNQHQRTHETMAAYERLHLAAAEERGGETLAAAWASVVRQWRVVLAAAGVGLVVALAFLAVTPPQYSARALVLIDPKNDFSVRATRAPTELEHRIRRISRARSRSSDPTGSSAR